MKEKKTIRTLCLQEFKLRYKAEGVTRNVSSAFQLENTNKPEVRGQWPIFFPGNLIKSTNLIVIVVSQFCNFWQLFLE